MPDITHFNSECLKFFLKKSICDKEFTKNILNISEQTQAYIKNSTYESLKKIARSSVLLVRPNFERSDFLYNDTVEKSKNKENEKDVVDLNALYLSTIKSVFLEDLQHGYIKTSVSEEYATLIKKLSDHAIKKVSETNKPLFTFAYDHEFFKTILAVSVLTEEKRHELKKAIPMLSRGQHA